MLDTAKRKAMLRQMIVVRAFEEQLEELYQRKTMFGSTHSYRGQEAIAVGVCSALQSTDLIASYHRGTGHLIARGTDLYMLLCECMGRQDGYSKGRGGGGATFLECVTYRWDGHFGGVREPAIDPKKKSKRGSRNVRSNGSKKN